ncbi:hypothetical protein AgCh_029323 [Apium graveolens]
MNGTQIPAKLAEDDSKVLQRGHPLNTRTEFPKYTPKLTPHPQRGHPLNTGGGLQSSGIPLEAIKLFTDIPLIDRLKEGILQRVPATNTLVKITSIAHLHASFVLKSPLRTHRPITGRVLTHWVRPYLYEAYTVSSKTIMHSISLLRARPDQDMRVLQRPLPQDHICQALS